MKDLSPRPCCHCGKPFTPQYTSMQIACTLRCAKSYAVKEREGKEKAERAVTKARRKALETIPALIKVAQREFNAFIRARDADQPCICCGQPLGEGDVGGAFDCGHYRSTGSASHLRFDERNAHAQRKVCNRWGAGRAVDYRIGLVSRIGLAAVEALETNNEPHKWTREELRQIAATYRQKRKEQEKGE
jgi:hypothetical protein